MNNKNVYAVWSSEYDSNKNRTRDLEAIAFQNCMNGKKFSHSLEIGCGTGKNTPTLLSVSHKVTAVDFSEEMLAIAKQKIVSENVSFITADITQKWDFAVQLYDLITFSLVLEHIEDLNVIFKKANAALVSDGIVYIGELHPFKQYTGSKARVALKDETVVADCYLHHLSDFSKSAIDNGFEVISIQEFWDEGDDNGIPRILSLLLKKYSS
jgi:ubiquinone/menaquinone biosynthesis C-methylase UbiE